MNNTAADLLPHHYPLRLPDRIMQRIPGISIVAEKHLSAGDFWMQGCAGGGFPDLFLIELCAQISGLALAENEQGQTAYLGAIRDFTFSRHVYAGDLLTVEAVIEGTFGTFVSTACRVTCAGCECAAGRLTLSFLALSAS